MPIFGTAYKNSIIVIGISLSKKKIYKKQTER